MRHKIYDKDGLIEKAEVKELEYSGVYEGERYITVKASSPYPVDFKIGDKLTYRGKVFTLDKISSIKRNARNYQSGKSIEYEGLRFLDTASELYDIQFCDYVLNDNNLPYTGLGTFSFYVSKAEDFGSRIQANLDLNYGEGKWKVKYGNSKDINKAKTMSIGSDTNVYDALVQFSNDYDVNFTINEYTITIGFTQEATEYEYFFGKGHGLTSLEVTTESSQRIVTRLKAYGSQRNIPYLYYTNLGKEYVVKVKNSQKYTSANVRLVLSVDLGLDFNENDSIFTNGVDIDPHVDWRNYKIKVRAGDTEAVAIIECHTSSSLQPANKANIYIGLDYHETDSKIVDKIIEYFDGISSYPTDLYITEGYDSDKVPYENTFIPSGVPNNMSVKNLMLPGFPNESLYDWATRISKEDTETGSKVLALIKDGFDFSKNQYLPYIISPKVKDYGIKDGEVTFDGSDADWDEVYPSLEGMTVGELSTISGYEGSLTFKGSGEVDRILSGSTISDNGVSLDGTYGDGSKDTGGVLMYASFEITIPNIGFNLWDYKVDGETPVIHMQDGMCAGRSFEILKCIPVNVDDIKKGYRLNLQRELDQSVNMYYPNRIYNISAGDKFVFEGIEMPDVYIEAASVRLLFQSIEKLRDIDYLKKTYKPEIDNIFMARNPNYAENLYEGIKMCIADDDLGIVAITISQLNIKETEGEIPKYEVTLDDESTAELLSLNIATGNATGNQQSTGQSIKLIRTNDDTTPTNRNAFSALRSLEEFLNKINPDTALEVITFLKGLLVGDGEYGIDADGIARLKKLLSDEATIKTLTVTGRAHFFELIIDELNSVGGQLIMSGANCTVRSVERISGAWRLWWLAEDSDGRAVQNMWKVGDQALSMTSNLAEGTSYDTGNRFWWRLVTATGSGTRNIDGEDRKCHWIEVSEATCAADSIEPAEGDSVCLCGHRGNDTARCHAIIIAAHSTPDTGLECPSIAQYNGITSFSLSQYRTTWFAANGNKIRGELDVDTSGLVSYTHLAWGNGPDDWTKDKSQSTAKDWLMLGICTDRTESDVNLVYSDYAWSRIKGTDGKDGTSFTVKGSVDDESMLPPTGNSTGDAYLVNGYLWVWDGSAWANAGKIQGPAGEDGADGKTTYFHIRYSPNPDGVPMSETPDVFIGTRVDFNPTASDVPSDYTWARFRGMDGQQGEKGDMGPQGVPGPSGEDGKTLYTWIRYADTAEGGGISNDPSGKKYIGFAYNKNTAQESDNPSDYTWSEIKGEDGVPGAKGEDGETLYTWIAYSDSPDGEPMYQTPSDTTKYIGIAVNKESAQESDNPSDYTWSKFRGEDGTSFNLKGSKNDSSELPQDGNAVGDAWLIDGDLWVWDGDKWVDAGNIQGPQGPQGEQGIPGEAGKDGAPGHDGKTTYFHVKYSSNENGNPMTETPNLYIGTYVDFTEADSDDPSDYTWSRFQGYDGEQGIPGTNGTDGLTYYLHIKYSDDGGKTFTANNGEAPGAWIGVMTDTNADDSTDPSEYTWSKIKGDTGEKGDKGEQGVPGPAGEDGRTTYFHVKYSSNSNGTPMSEVPNLYIGTYVDFTETDSDDPSDYTWSRFQGYDGEQGIPGTNGTDGKTSYLHIKYSDDGGKTFTANNGETPGAWLGQCVDFNSYDPTSVTSYKWTQIRGEDGADGSDGFGYSFSPANISMETNENGVVGTGNASATLSAYFGEQKATVTINSITTTNCSATKNGATITITSVKTYNYNGKTIPYSAGFININATATLNGRTQSFTARLDFSVSIMKYAAKLSVEQDNITSTVTKISQDQEELSGSVSEIKQTADNISLKVDRLNITDGNMIENSDIFLRGIAGSANKGYIIGDFSSWRGKTITVSCLIKTVNASANGNNRMGLEPTIYFKDGTRQFLGLWYYIGSNNTTEQRISKAFQIGDKEIEKIEQQTMYIQGLTSGYASVSRPKIEMGDTSTAWGLSEVEKEKKVNLLEDTATFGGATINGTIQKNAYTTEYGEVIDVLQSGSLAAGGEYIDVVRWNYVLTPEAGVQYTLSFWAKGTGEIRSFLAANVCDWVLGETKNEVGVSDGYIAFQLTSGWKRYSVTWSTRTDTSGAKNLIPVRLMPNSSSASQVSVCGVRFEKGSVATPWRGKPATDTNLLATGIDINNKKVIITSDNFEIRNNSGEVTTTVGEDGTLTGVTLETRDYGFGHIKMTNGLMEIYNPQGIMNAKFGFNGTYITLSFYDNDGSLRYDLNPSGLSGADLVQEKWIEDSSTYGLILKGDFEDIISDVQLLYRLFTVNYKWPARTYYRYIAGKIGELYVQGDYASTAEIAQGANDNWFSEKADVTKAATPIGSFVAPNTSPFYVASKGAIRVPTDYIRYESSYARKVDFSIRYGVKTIWRFSTLRSNNPVGPEIKRYGCKLEQFNVYMNLPDIPIRDNPLLPFTDTENEPDP